MRFFSGFKHQGVPAWWLVLPAWRKPHDIVILSFCQDQKIFLTVLESIYDHDYEICHFLKQFLPTALFVHRCQVSNQLDLRVEGVSTLVNATYCLKWAIDDDFASRRPKQCTERTYSFCRTGIQKSLQRLTIFQLCMYTYILIK